MLNHYGEARRKVMEEDMREGGNFYPRMAEARTNHTGECLWVTVGDDGDKGKGGK